MIYRSYSHNQHTKKRPILLHGIVPDALPSAFDSPVKKNIYHSLIFQFFPGFFQLLQAFFGNFGELQVKCLDF